MNGASHLLKRAGVYYLRRRVPLDLVERLGKGEVKVSLRTKDPREARVRARAADADVDRMFERARSGALLNLDAVRSAVATSVTTGLREYLKKDPLIRWRQSEGQYGPEPELREWLYQEAEVWSEALNGSPGPEAPQGHREGHIVHRRPYASRHGRLPRPGACRR